MVLRRLGHLVQYLLIALSFVTMFHYNLTGEYFREFGSWQREQSRKRAPHVAQWQKEMRVKMRRSQREWVQTQLQAGGPELRTLEGQQVLRDRWTRGPGAELVAEFKAGPPPREEEKELGFRLLSAYFDAVDYGRALGLAPRWKMYSPVPKAIDRVDWYGRSPDGEWVQLEIPNLMPEHRARQTFLERWVLDYKIARMYSNHIFYYSYYDKRLLAKYVRYHWDGFEEKLGWRPSLIKVVATQARIPPPDEKGDWTPWTAEYRRTLYEKTISYRD